MTPTGEPDRPAVPADFEQIRRALDGIDGWMTDAQGSRLAASAVEVPRGRAIVEIGSHHGRSTIVLALSKRPGVQLTAVDPFDDPDWGGGPESLELFERNLERAGVRAEVDAFRGLGEDAARGWNGPPVGMLFLDGAHDYRTVSREIALWKPHLAGDAAVLCHDAFSSHGVTRAVLREFTGSREFAYCGRTGTLARFERRGLGVAGRVRSTLHLLAELPYFARNIAVKIASRRGWTGAVRALGHTGTHDPY